MTVSKSLEPGALIDGTFRVQRLLGAGAAGEAYAVTLEKDWGGLPAGAALCLKMYKDEVFKREAPEAVIGRRLREAAVAASVGHPNLVRGYSAAEFFPDGRPRYLVLELLDGTQLDDFIRKNGPQTAEQVRTLMVQLCSAVYELHQRGLLHRDVKAANVVLVPPDRPVLLDLGVVGGPLEEGSFTGSQTFLGTLRYAAPEWLFAQSHSPASDVYSLGSILFHLLTGVELFHDTKLFSRLVTYVERRDVKFEQEFTDPGRSYAADVALLMLQKNPAARPSLLEVIEFFGSGRDSALWRRVRLDRIRSMYPLMESYIILPWIAEEVALHAPDVVDSAVARRDRAALEGIGNFRLLFHPSSVASVELYKSIPDEGKPNWVKRVLAALYSEEDRNDGQRIESAASVADALRKAETRPEMLARIEPDLEAAREEEKATWRAIALENP